MKKFLYWIILPAIVLGVVYHFGYSSGRSDGVRRSSAMPQITSVPVSVPPAPIASPTLAPAVVETSEVSPAPVAPVKRVRQTPDGLVVEHHSVSPLPSVKRSEKVVFRAPEVSGTQSKVSERLQQSELQPLKSTSTPAVLPPLAKPQAAPQDNDCGCGK